jgi:tetratricopeptide (TPR) repeat protein
MEENFRFEVAFSFAGPHRDKVRTIAELVSEKLDSGIRDHSKGRVFFDEWFEHEILGSDMDALLQRIYHEKSLMVVADLSEDYQSRRWPRAEERAIRALRLELDTIRDETARLRLINARFGDGDIPDVLPTEGYYDAQKRTPLQAAEFLVKRHALLRERMGSAAANPPPLVPPPAAPSFPAPPILFFHPATNDALYARRERELDWLDGCAKDSRIRIATVTGIGGLGKTSLVGHWIEVWKGGQHRAFRGVFFYSFYSDREPEHFFTAFIDFAYKSLGQDRASKEAVLHHGAATLAQRWPFLIVLDGLEVLQANADDSHYGWINDGQLNEFVSRLGEKGSSLLVLTSRFPFPEVTRQFPEHCRPLDLELFSPEEGADLLEKCGLPEDREACMAFSEQFGGHPLALRLFAGASLTAPATHPSDLSRDVMQSEKVSTLPDPDEPGISNGERQRRRHRRQFQKLLEWLQTKLSASKRRLLQLVALFHEPVPTATLIALATGLDAMKADFFDCDPARIRSLLDALVREHLLQREDASGTDTARWTAHPIVREVFRAEALKAGDTVAAQFAEIVAGKGEGGEPKSVAELEPILEAIEVLLAAGDIESADRLYFGRLDNGFVFLRMPAPQEGLRCAREFLEPMERRAGLERALGLHRVAFYLNEMALWASILGELADAERGYNEVVEISHVQGEWGNVSQVLENAVDVQLLRGALRDAAETASEGLFYAGVKETQTPSIAAHRFPKRPSPFPSHDSKHERNCRVSRATALSLVGELPTASRDFIAADTIERKNDPDNDALFSHRGIEWCRHRLRLGDTYAVRRLTEANRAICEAEGFNNDRARCDLLLGELDLIAGELDSASRRIGQAVLVFRKFRIGKELPGALLAEARSRLSVDNCLEALRLAGRSGFALKHCDALNLRALLRREAGAPTDAAEDAREALEIAERCGYYWGRHEALRQLRDIAKASGNRADEKHWTEAEQELSRRMQPLVKEALEIEHAHDREMEDLYGKKE